jgi:hypothetical protein
VKQHFADALAHKRAQRAENAARPIAEKLRTLEVLRDGRRLLKTARIVKSTPSRAPRKP